VIAVAFLLPTLLAGVFAIPATGASRGPGAISPLPHGRSNMGWSRVHHGPHGKIDVSVCPGPDPDHPLKATCFSRIRVDQAARATKPAGVSGTRPQSRALGDNGAYSPAYLQSAYNAPSSTAGAGMTVAIVDAYNDDFAESDLAEYRSHYGLPPCTTANGCFLKANQRGSTNPDDHPPEDPDGSWAFEISLDLDMVSAVCPNCHIILVEADNANIGNLGIAVDEAVTLGADVVSNSYGIPDMDFAWKSFDSHFDHPGVPITVSSGDRFYQASYPAVMPNVTAVGGTSLQQATASGSRDATETAWEFAGSGCSLLEAKPSWQQDMDCDNRTTSDVSAVADPATPVWVYDTYGVPNVPPGWIGGGGTSAAAPIVAAMYALAGGPYGPSYSPAAFPYAKPGSLNDVTSGSYFLCPGWNICQGQPGYDGPTGLGTPNGVRAFRPSAPSAPQHLTAGSYGGAAVLSWGPPALDGGAAVTGYRVYRADHGSPPIASLGPSATSFIDTGLQNGTAYDYTVKAVNAVGVGDGSQISATPALLDHVVLSPDNATITAGRQRSYTVEGFTAANNSLGDETAAASVSIGPNGSCAGGTCTSFASGDHTVTASLSGHVDTATLHVDPGPLDHITISPPQTTVASGGSQVYSSEGFDEFGNSLGDETGNTTFSIGPNGTCTGTSCTASDGAHTVTGAIRYTAVSAGLTQTCAILATGGLRCWGSNGQGELGRPDVDSACGPSSVACSASPVDVSGLTSVASVSAGPFYTCAATMDGAGKCWGSNYFRQFGYYMFTSSAVPLDVPGLSTGIADVSAPGIYQVCALTTGGGAKCLGNNSIGQLGDGTTDSSLIPVNVSGLTSGATAVDSSQAFSCAHTSGGGVKCWGVEGSGQLGNGISNCNCWSTTPVNPTGLTSGVAAVSTRGGISPCALTDAGGVKCWGENPFGELGNGTQTDSDVPVDVSGLSTGVVAISVGGAHACAVTSQGGVKCWGDNDHGQLGTTTGTCFISPDYSPPCSTVPIEVPGIPNDVVSVSAGTSNTHTCALTADGEVWCWGLNGYGELGNGTADATNSTPPVHALSISATATLHVGPPETTIDLGPSGLTRKRSPSFIFHASEPGSTFDCRLDSALVSDWQACSSPKSYSELPDGRHMFEVRASHSFGGTDATPATRSFRVDTTPPQTKITDFHVSSATRKATFSFTSNESGSTFRCKLDSHAYRDCDSPKTYRPLRRGDHTFRVYAMDRAGNRDPTPAVKHFTI
jgi:alpha-tubulin suppressor-like RCC1 family protein